MPVFNITEEKRRLIDLGVIRNGHFALASGLHSREYLNKNAIFVRPEELSRLCLHLAMRIAPQNPDVIVGPVVGGALIAQWVAYHLSAINGKPLRAVFADKDGDTFVLRRGYGALVTGKSVAIVEDILMTGSTIRKVINAVEIDGGNVIGVSALCNRGGVLGFDDVPHFSTLVPFTFDAFKPEECPLCASQIPISKEFGRGPPPTT